MKRLFTLFLCAIIVTTNVVPTFADEFESEAYEDSDYTIEEIAPTGDGEWGVDDWKVGDQEESIPELKDSDTNNDGAGEVMKPVVNDHESQYSIAISSPKISFGKQYVGYPIAAQEVVITNTGNTNVSLIWKDVDPDCAFVVDTTNAQNIAPGQNATIYVSVATNKGIGAYNGVILFADSSDTAYASGVKLETSVTIQEEKAEIKKLTLSPAETTASPGGYINYVTETEGIGEYDSSVSFSVKGNKSSATSIDSTGRLSIGNDETASSLIVTAVSNQNSRITKDAKVNLQKNTYTINVYADPREGGDVSGGGAYAQGSTATIKAFSSNGWYFVGWRINGSFVSTGTTYTIENIKSNYDVEAVFERDSVRIKARPNHEDMGTIDGDGYVMIGDTVILKAKAKKGYRFSCWMEGKKKISTDSKIKIKDVDIDREFVAVFVKDECCVSVASCDTTMGTVSGGKTVDYGKDVTIKAKANKGYRFVRWVCNDQEISQSAEYKLKELKDDITVVAIFEAEKAQAKKTYVMTSGTTDANGVISPSGAIVLEEGKSINYTITPKSGYKIAALAIDGKQVAVSSSITISDIRNNHSIVAAFLPIENAPKADTKKVEKSHNDASGSDVNVAVDATPEKKYEENIVEADIDTSNFVGDENDSMDNSLDDEEGVLQESNISTEDAMSMLGDDAFKYDMVRRAVASEYLEINIDNSMRKNKFVMSYDADALNNPETANFAKILCGVFSDDEVMDLASGKEQVYVDVSITGTQEDNVPLGQVSKIKEDIPENKTVGQYFFANFIKSVNGHTSEVSEFNTPLMVMVDIPDNIYQNGRDYQVARLHTYEDGTTEVSVLEDLDNDPRTITIETDRFSTYAILCDSDIAVDTNLPVQRPTIEKKTNWPLIIGVGAGCVVATVVAIGIIASIVSRNRRRRRRKNRRLRS